MPPEVRLRADSPEDLDLLVEALDGFEVHCVEGALVVRANESHDRLLVELLDGLTARLTVAAAGAVQIEMGDRLIRDPKPSNWGCTTALECERPGGEVRAARFLRGRARDELSKFLETATVRVPGTLFS